MTPRKPKAASDRWASRIVGTGDADPATLLANPQNWRVHTIEQRAAMSGVLGQVGWVQNVIVNRTSGRIVDGHLRVELARERGESVVPVVYVELSPAEEALVLGTLDTITTMAGTDEDAFTALLGQMDEASAALLAAMMEDVRPEFDPTGDPQPRLDERTPVPVTCPECGHEWTI